MESTMDTKNAGSTKVRTWAVATGEKLRIKNAKKAKVEVSWNRVTLTPLLQVWKERKGVPQQHNSHIVYCSAFINNMGEQAAHNITKELEQKMQEEKAQLYSFVPVRAVTNTWNSTDTNRSALHEKDLETVVIVGPGKSGQPGDIYRMPYDDLQAGDGRRNNPQYMKCGNGDEKSTAQGTRGNHDGGGATGGGATGGGTTGATGGGATGATGGGWPPSSKERSSGQSDDGHSGEEFGGGGEAHSSFCGSLKHKKTRDESGEETRNQDLDLHITLDTSLPMLQSRMFQKITHMEPLRQTTERQELSISCQPFGILSQRHWTINDKFLNFGEEKETSEGPRQKRQPGKVVTVATKISGQPGDDYRMCHIDVHAGDERLKDLQNRKSIGIDTTPIHVVEIHPVQTESSDPGVFVRCNVEGNKGGWRECTDTDDRVALSSVQRLNVDLLEISRRPVSAFWAVETDQGSSSAVDNLTITIEIRQVLKPTAKPAWGQPQTDEDIILFKKTTLKVKSAEESSSTLRGQISENVLNVEIQRKREEHHALEQQLEQLNIQLKKKRDKLNRLQASVNKNG